MAEIATVATSSQLTTNSALDEIRAYLEKNDIAYPSTASREELLTLIPSKDLVQIPTTISAEFEVASDISSMAMVESSLSTSSLSSVATLSNNSSVFNSSSSQAATPMNEEASSTAPVATDNLRITTYLIKDGDSLVSIANKVGLSIGTLKSLNPSLESSLIVGQTLKIN